MTGQPDFIILALPRWDAVYSSGTYSTAKALANGGRVFYIDHPFTLKDFVTKFTAPEIRRRLKALLFGRDIYTKVPGLPETFTAVTPRLMLPVNVLPEGRLYDFLSRVNDRILYATVRRIIRDFGVTSFVYLNSYDPCYGLHFPASFRPSLTVYKTSDDISQAPYTARHGVRTENEMIRRAGLTLATSKHLTALKTGISPSVRYLPNAADTELFRRAGTEALPRPAELRSISTKIIGYMGALSTRLDYELLKKTAEYHADKTLVLVGSKDNADYRPVGLEDMPNVVFTGARRLDELPAYLACFDCAIIPFECSVLTKSIYPLKLNEYLSGGKPVVMTDFADVSEFESVVAIARSHDEFIRRIDEEIASDSPSKRSDRMAAASSHNWQARATELLAMIREASNLEAA